MDERLKQIAADPEERKKFEWALPIVKRALCGRLCRNGHSLDSHAASSCKFVFENGTTPRCDGITCGVCRSSSHASLNELKSPTYKKDYYQHGGVDFFRYLGGLDVNKHACDVDYESYCLCVAYGLDEYMQARDEPVATSAWTLAYTLMKIAHPQITSLKYPHGGAFIVYCVTRGIEVGLNHAAHETHPSNIPRLMFYTTEPARLYVQREIEKTQIAEAAKRWTAAASN